MFEGVARCCCVFGVVRFTLDGGYFAGFDVEVVDVVPFYLEGLARLVDGDGEPDVAGFPEGNGIPLVAQVEVGGSLGTVYAE